MGYKECRPIDSSSPHFVHSELMRKALAMIAERIGRRSVQRADDVCVVAKGKYSGIWKIFR